MNNETKFTAGPWVYSPKRDMHDNIIHQDGAIERRGYINEGGVVGSSEYIWLEEADAHLIAAAPEMYAMIESLASELNSMIEAENARLKGMVSCTDLDMPDYIDQESIHDAQVLLAKARGDNNEQ